MKGVTEAKVSKGLPNKGIRSVPGKKNPEYYIRASTEKVKTYSNSKDILGLGMRAMGAKA